MYLDGGNFYIFSISGFSLENTRKSGHFLVRKRILRKMKSCHHLNTSGSPIKFISRLSILKCKLLEGLPYAFHSNILPYILPSSSPRRGNHKDCIPSLLVLYIRFGMRSYIPYHIYHSGRPKIDPPPPPPSSGVADLWCLF